MFVRITEGTCKSPMLSLVDYVVIIKDVTKRERKKTQDTYKPMNVY